jgi:hypothetical protein
MKFQRDKWERMSIILLISDIKTGQKQLRKSLKNLI